MTTFPANPTNNTETEDGRFIYKTPPGVWKFKTLSTSIDQLDEDLVRLAAANNSEILAQVTAAFTVEDKDKLDSLTPGDETPQQPTDPSTPTPPEEPTQNPPDFFFEWDGSESFQIQAQSGANRKIVVVCGVEDDDAGDGVPASITGCSISGHNWLSYDSGQIVLGYNVMRAFVFDVPDSVQAGTSLTVGVVKHGIAATQVLHLKNVTGDVLFSSETGENVTTVSSSITTTVAESVVASFVITGNGSPRTTVYGDLQEAIETVTSTARTTVALNAGPIGEKTIVWTGDGTLIPLANRTIVLNLEVGAIAPAPSDPTPDPAPEVPVGEASIWNTKVATTSVLQPSGFGITSIDNIGGGPYTNTGQIELGWRVPWDAGQPLVNVWECRYAPNYKTSTNENEFPFTNNSNKRLIGQVRPSAAATPVFLSDQSNQMCMYEDASGNIIFGGGDYKRFSASGDIYHMWQVPGVNSIANQHLGTRTAPGRGGACGGASSNSMHGMTIKNEEIAAAKAGDANAIKHAIGIVVWGAAYLYRAPTESGAYRWPAYQPDDSWDDGYDWDSYNQTARPWMKMGAHLCLERRITAADVPLLGLDTPMARMYRAIAEALYLYGCYITDNNAWHSFSFVFERDQSKSISNDERFAIPQMVQWLRCIDNNGPDRIGGGAVGDPRRS